MRATAVRLEEPPVVTSVGIAVHGPVGHTDVFRPPDLWQLHLYRYEADLTVAGTQHAIRPDRVSLTPPATTCQYRYRGRSEHLLRPPAPPPPRGEPHTVPDIARAAGVSHDHLTRLFRASTGGTVVAHIRQRRLPRPPPAVRVPLSVSAIATQVGLPSLQAFNKACPPGAGGLPAGPPRGISGPGPTAARRNSYDVC